MRVFGQLYGCGRSGGGSGTFGEMKAQAGEWKRKQYKNPPPIPRNTGVNSLPRIQHIAVNERMILRVEIRKGVD